MFIPSHIKEVLCQPGTLRVHIAFGEFHINLCNIVNDQYIINQCASLSCHLRQIANERYIVVASVDFAPRINIKVFLDLSTVRALYEGLLVTSWTTAQKRPQRRWSCLAQLAFLLLFFATLTIVGRCYASTNDVAAPLDQFHPRLQNNSIHPTSNLVLGRLFIPNRFVKSDTRLIREENHTKVLFNRNLRTKRDFEKTNQQKISTPENRNSKFSARRNLRSNDGIRRLTASDRITESIGAGNSSTRVTVNETAAEDRHQNDSHFQEDTRTGEGIQITTQQPMPPAHAHDNESGK